MKITFVQTGGTIDKHYPQTERNHGYEFVIGEPAFVPILKKINPDFEYEIVSVLKKDSLDITDDDRQKISDSIRAVDNDKIVITHGTDTILQTAKALANIKDKTVVLTGATLPEKFTDSDAMFNLGMAVGAVESLAHGVYIALNGVVVSHSDFKPR